MENNALIKNTLDQIPTPAPNAKQIVGLIKQNGRVEGYRFSDGTTAAKPQAVEMAKRGEIKGVGIAHRKGNEYLKSIPNSSESDNLSLLPSETM